MRKFRPGDQVIYYQAQYRNTATPGGNVATLQRVEQAVEVVDHYMTVRESSRKGTLVLVANSGQLHVTHNDDPNIRRASLWERFRYRDRFPRLA